MSFMKSARKASTFRRGGSTPSRVSSVMWPTILQRLAFDRGNAIFVATLGTSRIAPERAGLVLVLVKRPGAPGLDHPVVCISDKPADAI